ncbi:rCG32411 [Rattus norvegicus]|uniref:RCG32411 n=1 Tax=Rattus norvegicus TaxID=10116 RepID=A6JWY5_RAT|nr:rCG32411 [Rattus norvegicus]
MAGSKTRKLLSFLPAPLSPPRPSAVPETLEIRMQTNLPQETPGLGSSHVVCCCFCR